MNQTFVSNIKHQLTKAGYCIVKDHKEKQWKLLDSNNEVMYNSSQGVLLRNAAKAFNLDWED